MYVYDEANQIITVGEGEGKTTISGIDKDFAAILWAKAGQDNAKFIGFCQAIGKVIKTAEKAQENASLAQLQKATEDRAQSDGLIARYTLGLNALNAVLSEFGNKYRIENVVPVLGSEDGTFRFTARNAKGLDALVEQCDGVRVARVSGDWSGTFDNPELYTSTRELAAMNFTLAQIASELDTELGTKVALIDPKFDDNGAIIWGKTPTTGNGGHGGSVAGRKLPNGITVKATGTTYPGYKELCVAMGWTCKPTDGGKENWHKVPQVIKGLADGTLVKRYAQ